MDIDLSRTSVLDHGYVRLVESWGSGDAGIPEAGIIEAARQSTQGAFRGWDRDQRLLKYLYEHHHSTPFEFAGMVLEIQAPIFVFREWQRHRTQSYNEMSARYAPLPDLYYLPTLERTMVAGGDHLQSNKQATAVGGAVQLTELRAQQFISETRAKYEAWELQYQADLQAGIPKELARIGMPVGHYSRMRAQANLRNWLGFLTLRMDPSAQLEIQLYARAVGNLVAEQFPRTWALFNAD